MPMEAGGMTHRRNCYSLHLSRSHFANTSLIR
jgi:hypothetical protein